MSELERVPYKDQIMIPAFQGNDPNYQLIKEKNVGRQEASVRQSELASMINGITDEQKTSELGIWEAARTPNTFNVRAQQALQPFMNLKAKDSVTFFDLEAIGTPSHLRGKDDLDLFAITELSFGGTKFNGKDFVNNQKIVSMAVAPSSHEYARFKQAIDRLKTNSMAGLSQDMHRSLLDLVKYADLRKFADGEYGGRKFKALTGHNRVPVANTALTGKTLKEVELGLNNLYHHGTKLDDAFDIFKTHIQRTDSKLAGYNIHAYDLPAMMSVMKDKDMKSFFETKSKESLDFYHGYNAAVEDPYSLTGASLRQEHIHQALLNKKVVKGSQDKYLYHLAKDDIKANMEIASFMGEKIDSYIKSAQKEKSSEFVLTPKQLKTDILKKGTQVFSYQSGFFDPSKHKYNMVGRVEDDKMQPRWANLNTPIPSNERFQVGDFFKDVKLPNTDKKGVGVRLDSKDIKGKSVMLFSETQEELAQQIHGSFLPLSKKETAGFRKLKVEHDQPFEQYKKMFEEGGWKRMKNYYDILDSKPTDLTWTEHVLKQGGSEELAMKFPHMATRLQAEKKIWNPVMEELKNSNLTDEQKTMVLRHVKNNLDELGDNRATVKANGSKFFSFSFGNDDTLEMNARDSNSIKNAFRNFIKGKRQGERFGDAEASYKVARINDLSNLIIDQFRFAQNGPEAAKVKALAEGMIQEVHNGGKIETALTGLANMVRTQVEEKGSNKLTREITNQVTPKRVNAIRKLSENLPEVVKDSIGHASAIKNGKDAFGKDSVLANFVEEQDQRIRNLFERNFKLRNQHEHIEKAANSAAKYEDLLKGIVNAYKTEFNTSIHFREGDNKPYLVLADKKAGLNTNEVKSFSDLVRNPRTSVVALPYLDENLMVRYGSERKVPVMRSGIRKGVQYHSTSVTDALSMMLNQAQNKSLILKQKGEAGVIGNHFYQIEQGLKFVVGQQVNPISGDAFGMLSHEDQKMFAANSAIASRARSGMWDLSGYAEEWYRANAVKLGFASTQSQADKKANDIAARAEANHTSFAKEMDMQAKSYAIGGGLRDFAAQKSNLKGSYHGLNNNAASRFLVGTDVSDTRQYIGLGNMLGDAGENPLKTINYRKLDEERVSETLTKAGQMQDYRLNHSFISDAAHEALSESQGEYRGLALKTGFISDEEIASKLKDTKRVAEYKKQIDQAKKDNRITDAQARQMKRALDNGMISTDEGMAVMDAELLSAYDGWDEVRVRAEGEVRFHPKIEDAIQKEAMKQGLAVDQHDKSWKRTGITFDKPVEVDLQDAFDKDGKKITLGDYTINNITQKIEEEKRLRPDKKIAVMGYNVDDPYKTGLVLGRERLSGQGTKIVTESGFRGTVVPMLKEVISDIYGDKDQGVEFLRSHLSEKKGGNSLMDQIRGIDMDIRQQFDGSVEKKIKGFDTAEEALSAFYKDVETRLGIKTKVEDNGIRTVDRNFGFDRQGNVLNREASEQLQKDWANILGREKTTAASIVMAHNVDTNYFGAVNSGKITVKEIDYINQGFLLAGITKPGEESNYTQWLKKRVYGSETSPEVRAQQKVFGEVVQAMSAREKNGSWLPKEGDAVIDFTSEGNATLSGVNAEMKDGILHVSKDTFQPILEPTAKGQKLTVSDYNKTIVNAGAAEINLGGQENPIKLSEHLRQTNGTAYIKLPDYMKQEYIPLVDVNSMKMPDELEEDEFKFLNNIQGKYAAIGKRMQEFEKLQTNSKLSVEDVATMREKLVEDLDRDITGLTDTFKGMTSNKGTQAFMSRRLENSTRLGSTGVNPVLAYKKTSDGKWINRTELQEAHVYMNEKDVRTQIKGLEERIAQSWGIDTSKVEGDLTDHLIENWNKNDTYVMTHRNPSIDSATLQFAKVKIDDSVSEGRMLNLRGMSERLSEDYDGDQKGVHFGHYSITDDKEFDSVMKDIKRVQKVEFDRNTAQAGLIMDDIQNKFESNLSSAVKQLTGDDMSPDHEQIKYISNKFFSESGLPEGKKLTLGSLHGEQVHDVIMESLKESHTDHYKEWGMSKNGDSGIAKIEAEKTMIARTSGISVGPADMIRLKMSAAFMENAQTKYKYFNEAEGAARYTQKDFMRETATVNEFLREFSQKAISTKHTGAKDGEDAVRTAIGEMYSVMNRVRDVKNEGDLDDLAQSIINRGMFKEAPMLEIGGYQRYQGSNVDFVKDALSILRDTEHTYRSIGMSGSDSSSLLMAASQGVGEKQFTEMAKTGEHIPTLANKFLSDIAKEHGNTKMDEFNEAREAAVIRQHQQRFANIEDRLADASATDEIMSNPIKATPLVNSNQSMPVHRTIRDHADEMVEEIATTAKHKFGASASSALGVIGLSFGALWATNALMKSAPTPEGLQEMAPVSPDVLTTPTARVTPNQNGEYLNIQVNAKAAQRMSHEDLAAMINNEVMSMSNIKMNTSINVNDNSKKVDKNWLDSAVANAMDKGYAY